MGVDRRQGEDDHASLFDHEKQTGSHVPLRGFGVRRHRGDPRLNEYVFPAARDRLKHKPATIFNGWSKPKVAFDKACPIAAWTLHDLRRTFATNLAALGTPIHVTEKLLNHISGTVSGVAAIYNRHAYLDEMRAAIDAWEKRLSVILSQHNSDNSNGSPPPECRPKVYIGWHIRWQKPFPPPGGHNTLIPRQFA